MFKFLSNILVSLTFPVMTSFEDLRRWQDVKFPKTPRKILLLEAISKKPVVFDENDENADLNSALSIEIF